MNRIQNALNNIAQGILYFEITFILFPSRPSKISNA
jgi:hypothetical protein